MESPSSADVVRIQKMRLPYEGQRINALILSLGRFEAGSRWLRDLLRQIEIEASLWGPSAVFVMPCLLCPAMAVAAVVVLAAMLAIMPAIIMSAIVRSSLCLVMCPGGSSLHCRVRRCSPSLPCCHCLSCCSNTTPKSLYAFVGSSA